MKSRNPYRIQTQTFNRFRGLSDEDGGFNIAPQYVGTISNFTAQKIGEMNQRDGQDESDHYPEGVQDAGRLVTSKFLVEGGNVYAEGIIKPTTLPVKDYSAPSEWTYPWDSVQELGSTLTELVPVPTCSDVWATNAAMEDYEEADQSDTDVSDGTDPCWTITCGDLWALFPEYASYQNATYETTETNMSGGSLAMSACWSENLNCKALYKLYPSWDQYRTEGQFPDCWDFTFDVDKMSCQDVFDQQGTPEELQKTDGVFPDCLQYPPSIVLNKLKPRIDAFESTPATLEFELAEGYVEADTAQELVVYAEGAFSNSMPENYLEMTNPNLNFEIVDVVEDFFFKTIGSASYPTRVAEITYSVTVKEGITDE